MIDIQMSVSESHERCDKLKIDPDEVLVVLYLVGGGRIKLVTIQSSTIRSCSVQRRSGVALHSGV